MEANTVVLDLGEYNSLRDFRDEMEKGHTFYVLEYTGYCGYTNTYRFVSTDEAVKVISQFNEKLQKRISDLEIEIYDLKNPEKKEVITIEQVKKMSLWQFLMWKRKNKK